MKCLRAIIYYKEGKPASYSLIIEDMGRADSPKRGAERETTFREAYELFPAIHKHWNADGTGK